MSLPHFTAMYLGPNRNDRAVSGDSRLDPLMGVDVGSPVHGLITQRIDGGFTVQLHVGRGVFQGALLRPTPGEREREQERSAGEPRDPRVSASGEIEEGLEPPQAAQVAGGAQAGTSVAQGSGGLKHESPVHGSPRPGEQ